MDFTDFDRRIVAGGEFRPEEYGLTVGFEGWETEDGTDRTGWDLRVVDAYHGVTVLLRYDDASGEAGVALYGKHTHGKAD